jgi:uncharacterized protein
MRGGRVTAGPVACWVGRLAALTLFFAAAGAAAEKEVPFLTAHVNDLAKMLPDAARSRIEQKLRDLEARTGAQVAVLTVDSLDGESLEGYSIRVAQTWKLGRKGVDNGVLLFIAKQDRKMRIEVGYGLEAKLTDLVSRQILDDRLRPRFRQGDFAAGIEAGVEAIIATVEGTPLPAPAMSATRRSFVRPPLMFILPFMGIFSVVVGVFSFIALATPGSTGWMLYVFLMPFYAAFPTAAFPPYGGVVACAARIVLYPILRLRLDPGGKDFKKRHPDLASLGGSGGHSGSGGGFSSGGGGGGGFSGGGGSFGGGGSSSSW